MVYDGLKIFWKYSRPNLGFYAAKWSLLVVPGLGPFWREDNSLHVDSAI